MFVVYILLISSIRLPKFVSINLTDPGGTAVGAVVGVAGWFLDISVFIVLGIVVNMAYLKAGIRHQKNSTPNKR